MNLNWITITTQPTGNPVARAIARDRLRKIMRDWQISLLMLEDGAECRDHVVLAAQIITSTMQAMEMAGRAGAAEFAVMRGAISALQQCAERGFSWRRAAAPAVDVAAQRVLEIYPSIPSDIATKAFRQVADWDATITKAQQILAAQALPSSPG